jgi:hypothetical protein
MEADKATETVQRRRDGQETKVLAGSTTMGGWNRWAPSTAAGPARTRRSSVGWNHHASNSAARCCPDPTIDPTRHGWSFRQVPVPDLRFAQLGGQQRLDFAVPPIRALPTQSRPQSYGFPLALASDMHATKVTTTEDS